VDIDLFVDFRAVATEVYITHARTEGTRCLYVIAIRMSRNPISMKLF